MASAQSNTLPHLPPEIWLHVFYFATFSNDTVSHFATSYHPFQSPPAITFDKEVLHAKAAIIRVCRQWRQLGAALLYEDILVLRNNAKTLRHALHNEHWGGTEAAKMVHRIVLPYSSSVTRGHSTPVDSVDFLRECAELKILVRPAPYSENLLEVYTRFDFPAGPCPPLSSLQRLDWWHHNDASRTGGINSLPEVLIAAPNLQYLTLAGDIWLGLLLTSPVELKHLTTLRLRRVNILFIRLICQWSLPSLDTLIIDTFVHPQALQRIWETFGKQIRRLELGRSMKFYVDSFLYIPLAECENLQVLNYYIQFTAPVDLQTRAIWHHALETVGFHALTAEAIPEDWEHLRKHFQLFSRPSFTRLKRIVLYGDWKNLMANPCYPPLVQKLLDRQRVVEMAEDASCCMR